MIIKASTNGHAGNLYRHLSRTDDGNERVTLCDFRGVTVEPGEPDTLRQALAEMKAGAVGTRCDKSFFHASFAPAAEDEGRISPAMWDAMVDRYEKHFRLEGCARVTVEHVKEGCTHRHVVWSRIDESGRAVPLSYSNRRSIEQARVIEREHGLRRVSSERPAHRAGQRPPSAAEAEQTRRTKTDVAAVRDDIAAAWRESGNGAELRDQLAARGLVLARGEKRDALVIDQAGNFHALGRASGARAAEVRAKLGDVAADLPDLDQARAQQHQAEQSHDHAKRIRKDEPRPAEPSASEREAMRWQKQRAEIERQAARLEAQQQAERRAQQEAQPKRSLFSIITGRHGRERAAWEQRGAVMQERHGLERDKLKQQWEGAARRHGRRADQCRAIDDDRTHQPRPIDGARAAAAKRDQVRQAEGQKIETKPEQPRQRSGGRRRSRTRDNDD